MDYDKNFFEWRVLFATGPVASTCKVSATGATLSAARTPNRSSQ